MPFAIHLFFDPDTEAIIKTAWKKLAETGIAPYMHRSANRPHFSLAIYQSIHLAACEQKLQSLSAAWQPLPVSFQSIGIFPTTPATVFLSSPVTTALLDLHAEVHQALHPTGIDPSQYYLPGKWVPHCTLALDLEPGLLPQVLKIGLQMPLPINGEITEIGAIEFRPVRHLFRFSLAPHP